MKQPPFFDKAPNDDSHKLWSYIDGSLTEHEIKMFEKALGESESLREELKYCQQLSESFQTYQQQPVPHWNPTSIFKFPLKLKPNNWLPTALAATALMVSLLPYIHINKQSISVSTDSSYVSTIQLDQALNDFGFQQSMVFTEKLEQLKSEQNTKNQQMIVSLLNYAEKRRHNDLLQMVNWFSHQTELNQNQQRQIVNWVANEQQQDKQAISTLFSSISDEALTVSNEVQP